MSEQIRREFTLSYSMDKVKQAIEDTCRTSVGSYQIQNRNEVFNSYSISLVKMLSVLPVQIQLKKINDNETLIDFSAVAGPQLSRVPIFVSEMIDPFLSKIGKFLSGQLVVTNQTPAPLKPSRDNILNIVVIIIFVVIFFAAIAYILT